jgi:hypothetical protein
MKKRNKIWIYALAFTGLLLIITSACKKDDKEENKDVTPVVTDNLTASINGNSFVATTVLRQTLPGYIVITGHNNVQSLVLSLPDTLKAGTYSLGEFGKKCNLQHAPNINGTEIYSSISGTLVLTEFSTTGKIKGTFNAVLTKVNDKKANISITNGIVEVDY